MARPLLLLLALCVATSYVCDARVPQKPPTAPKGRRLLDDDGTYCDEDSTDPWCPGPVPATACGRYAAFAATSGFGFACYSDAGCMRIALGQLDVDCAEYFAAGQCSARCQATLAWIGPACRQAIMGYEVWNNQRMAMMPGGQQLWLWTPAFQKCGLAQVGWRKLLGAPAPAGKPGPGFTPLPEGGSVRDLVAAHERANADFAAYASRRHAVKP